MFDVSWFFFTRYLIPSLDRANAGHYRCIVRNRVGAIMQCSTEVQVACELMRCRKKGNGKDGWRNSSDFTHFPSLSVPLFPPFPSLSCHPVSPITSLLPSAIVLLLFSLHCLPAPHPALYTSPSLLHQYFILPLSSPALHLVFSLRQIWAVSWRPSDPRRCHRARAPWCTRRGYTAFPGRRSLGSETAARFPPAAACECTSCFFLGEVTCWSVLSPPGKVYFIFLYFPDYRGHLNNNTYISRSGL